MPKRGVWRNAVRARSGYAPTGRQQGAGGEAEIGHPKQAISFVQGFILMMVVRCKRRR